MHLIYLDESGNSGLNFLDPQQPVFVLCAMIVPEERWHSLENALKESLHTHIPGWQDIIDFEVHAADLRMGRGHFAGMSVSKRIELRDEWMKAAKSHGVRLAFRSVHKRRYVNWLQKQFGPGVVINPHIVAFAMLARCLDKYLKNLENSPRGMFISDENKEVVADVEKSIRILRGDDGKLRLSQIVEKGFFIDSRKSFLLQLCDLFALAARKRTERAYQLEPKTIDDSAIEILSELFFEDREDDADVFEWLGKQQKQGAKKERPGDKPRVD
ncbi:MAG TPA: DUF3800 domain-containing protein [Tepidisphaeraceae bacterium]|nr:DUF3800 domain-containing protein [Tepidisphaeraceae bacterium]